MATEMTDILKTKKRDYKYNGPVDSSDYNSRIEENYQDLVYLYNKSNIVNTKLSDAFERVLKDHAFLSNAINDISDRIRALESDSNTLSIHSFSQLDYSNFIGTSFAVSGTELLSFDPTYNIISLPKVSSGSFSKLKFGQPGVGQIVPDYFKAMLNLSFAGVDTNGAIIDSTPMYNAILDSPDKVWKRTVISPSNPITGAQMMFYVRVSPEISGSSKTNAIKLNPFPAFGVEIYSIEYTTDTDPSLSDTDTWIPLNSRGYYDGDISAIGKVAPGGWVTAGADSVKNSGPLCYQFPSTDITGIRIKFNQKNYFTELGNYIYTYGLSDLDIRYDKFLPIGRTIIKYTPKTGDVIEEITNVTPKIYNVPLSQIGNVFEYRIIYDNGGTYSLDNPGANNHVWIEVTLSVANDTTAPVLSDLIIQYN
jgi:hypothetical protein